MAFEKNWRERRIVHRTPGGKLTRVKISSLPADEQQKYNPNRYKRLGADKEMSPDDFDDLQKRDIEAGHIFDFYIQLKDSSELDDIEEGTLVLATSDSNKVMELFDDDMKIIKLKNVPMDAVKKVILPPENETSLDFKTMDGIDFDDIDELEGKERYEKIKFNDDEVYLLDIAPYMDYMEVVIDEPTEKDSESEIEMEEGFFNFYYRGDR